MIVRLIALAVLVFGAGAAVASDAIDVSMNESPQSFAAREHPFVRDIPGVGNVTLSGQIRGSQIVVRAYANSGELIGKAEGTLGLNRTPIFLKGSDHLVHVVLLWSGSPPQQIQRTGLFYH